MHFRHQVQQPRRPRPPPCKLLSKRETPGLVAAHALFFVLHHAPKEGVLVDHAIDLLAIEALDLLVAEAATGNNTVEPPDPFLEPRRRQLVERFDTKCAAERCDIAV